MACMATTGTTVVKLRHACFCRRRIGLQIEACRKRGVGSAVVSPDAVPVGVFPSVTVVGHWPAISGSNSVGASPDARSLVGPPLPGMQTTEACDPGDATMRETESARRRQQTEQQQQQRQSPGARCGR